MMSKGTPAYEQIDWLERRVAELEQQLEAKTNWQLIEYGESAGHIELPQGAPFDGMPVLLKTRSGVVEGWWCDFHPAPTLYDQYDGYGWYWVCYDDTFELELDDPTHWMPLPEPPKDVDDDLVSLGRTVA
jgi:hypothetical protein